MRILIALLMSISGGADNFRSRRTELLVSTTALFREIGHSHDFQPLLQLLLLATVMSDQLHPEAIRRIKRQDAAATFSLMLGPDPIVSIHGTVFCVHT